MLLIRPAKSQITYLIILYSFRFLYIRISYGAFNVIQSFLQKRDYFSLFFLNICVQFGTPLTIILITSFICV